MIDKTTLPEYLWPEMNGASLILDHCAVCGRTGHLEQHHIVRRGAGELFKNGRKMKKPTITLCGRGNTSGCHGLAHQNRLHFRWVPTKANNIYTDHVAYGEGHWEFLLLPEPTKHQDALEMEGWQRCR